MKEKVVVTGGAGFIGSHLVDLLVQEGFDVHVVDNLSGGKIENINPKATFHQADIRDLEIVRPIVAHAKYVFHLAALPQVQLSIDDPIMTGSVNEQGTLNMILVSAEAKVEKFVFSSSCAVYGDQATLPLIESMSAMPKSPYALHKLIGEEYLKLFSRIYGLPTVSLRYFNVYGPRQSVNGSYPLVIAKFIDLKTKGLPLTITGDGSATRDFVHVKDVARANLLAARSSRLIKGEVLNIGSGQSHAVKDIAKMVGGPTEHIPPRVEPKDALADVALAQKILDWAPSISLEKGIKELL